MYYGRPYRAAVALQGVLFKTATAPDTDKKVLASLALAWDKLEERKRIIKMRPLPKSVDVSKLQRSKQSSEPVFTES